MQRERVTDDVYVFTSDLYAQVTAGVVITSEGIVLIDTLAYPEETRIIKTFIEERLHLPVRYVINTHFHGDHTIGTYLFPDAVVIGHEKCRLLLNTRGRENLNSMRQQEAGMDDVHLVLPQLVFNDRIGLHLGNKTLELWSTPGHSLDSIVCHVIEDNVLFAADTLMPIPYFVDGDFDKFLGSLRGLQGQDFDHIVQGHGELILRGEVEEKVQSDIDYLLALKHAVDAALDSENPQQALEAIDIEQCGKSRILLNGMVEQLHRNNIRLLAD